MRALGNPTKLLITKCYFTLSQVITRIYASLTTSATVPRSTYAHHPVHPQSQTGQACQHFVCTRLQKLMILERHVMEMPFGDTQMERHIEGDTRCWKLKNSLCLDDFYLMPTRSVSFDSRTAIQSDQFRRICFQMFPNVSHHFQRLFHLVSFVFQCATFALSFVHSHSLRRQLEWIF
jgi:hypothetical protein